MNDPANTPIQRLERPNGGHIAYRSTPAKRKGLPGVVFIHGLRSDMDGGKAETLETFLAERGQAFVRFDCSGHGQSSGKFEETTLADWADDALLVFDKLTEGPQIVVGSSMGGWLMLLTGLARPERTAGLVGIAAAPDFTARFQEELSAADRETLRREGRLLRPTDYDDDPYVFTREMLDAGAARTVLDKPLAYKGGVRLLHGMLDDAVPWRLSLEVAAKAETDNVRVHLIKDGDHRLSRESDLALLRATVAELSEAV